MRKYFKFSDQHAARIAGDYATITHIEATLANGGYEEVSDLPADPDAIVVVRFEGSIAVRVGDLAPTDF